MTTSYRTTAGPAFYADLLAIRDALEAEFDLCLRGKPWWTAPVDSPNYARGQELSRQLGNLHLTLARALAEGVPGA
jgi:hypothetical protein